MYTGFQSSQFGEQSGGERRSASRAPGPVIRPGAPCPRHAWFYLDHNVGAVILVNPRGRLLHCNRVARRIIDRRDGLRLREDGVVSTADQGLADAWSEAIHDAASASWVDASMCEHAIRIPRAVRRLPYVAFLMPIESDGDDQSGEALPNVLITLRDPDGPASPGLQSCLRKVFDLTDAECRVAMLVVEGHRPQSAAEVLGNSINTVNSHLKNIYAKTGVSGQSDLVRVCLKLGPTVHWPPGG